MEVRSSRRVRTLVTQMAPRGLSANEIARALISMMARSTASNQRPDTLMQDRLPPALRNLLATHGRTIHLGSNSEVRARNWAVRFTLKNRHHQPGLSGPKSAISGSAHT
jgi:hypothetical protein